MGGVCDVDAPTITVQTPSWWSGHDVAMWAIEMPVSFEMSLIFPIASKRSSSCPKDDTLQGHMRWCKIESALKAPIKGSTALTHIRQRWDNITRTYAFVSLRVSSSAREARKLLGETFHHRQRGTAAK
jgi:hypothetical protein